jgi:glycosyltransferase involved in cell wall biosynthesis
VPFSNLFVKKVVQDLTSGGIDWQREKWQSGFGSKFIRQGEKNAVKYADEVIVLSKGVQKYFMDTYGRETHFIPNGVNRPQIRKANLITEKFELKKDSYILFLGRLVPEKVFDIWSRPSRMSGRIRNWSSQVPYNGCT